MKKIILNFMWISLVLLSCKKEKEINQINKNEEAFNVNIASMINGEFDGNFIVSQSDWGFSSYGINEATPFTVSSMLYADASMTSLLNVGNITVDTVVVSPDNSNNYLLNFNQIKFNNLLNKMSDSLTYQIAGNPSNGILPMQFKSYYPKRLDVVSPQFPNSQSNPTSSNPPTLNKNGSIELNWTPDVNSSNNQVVIHVVYKPSPSLLLNNANPSSLPITKVLTDDDGTYTLSLSALPNINYTSHFQIWVSRYSFSGELLGSKEYAFIQVANVYDDFILNP